MTHPAVAASVDGVPVAGLFLNRLVDLTILDRGGVRSDTIEITFDDSPPHFQSPRRGARIEVTLAMPGGASFRGSYIVDRVTWSCLPYKITVAGHAADLRAGMRTLRSRHWDDTPVGDIVAGIAGENGLEPVMAEAVSGHVYDWIAQQDESDLHFPERLARRHGALFSIKEGRLLWLERGAGARASGELLPRVLIHRDDVIPGTFRMSETDVDLFGTVRAFWQDRDGATRQPVEVEGIAGRDGVEVLREPFGSRDEAEKAAQAAAVEMRQGRVSLSLSVVGRPDLMAGGPVTVLGIRPLIDGRIFVLDQVQHHYSKSGGLRTALSGRIVANEES